jgi:predicted Zn-dependent protease with MMP-like domain
MDREAFDRLVHEAVADLPAFFRQKLENVAMIVEDEPSPELAAQYPGRLLLGLYRGVHPQNRSVWNLKLSPDLIYIFQRNIERVARTEEAIRQQVRKTVMHEIGHYFGLDEAELRRLGL